MLRVRIHFVILVLLMGVVLLRESRQQPMREIDESFGDFLARNSQRTEKSAPATLIAIDESSLKDHPWPWTPLDFALFFQSANSFAPDALATDEILRWESDNPSQQAKLPQYKKFLREHLLQAPKVLLGARLGFPEDPQVIPPLQEVPLVRNVHGDIRSIAEFTTIEAQAEEEFGLSTVAGFTNLERANKRHHSVPLLWRYRGQVVASFVLQAVILWEKLTLDDLVVEAGQQIKVGDRFVIPIDARGEMRVDFGVPRNVYSFDELVLASAQFDAQTTPVIPIENLKGKFLLLSRTDPASQTLRLAAGRQGSPGELMGAAIATIQNRCFLKRSPAWLEYAIILLAIILGWFVPRWPVWAVVAGAIVAIIAYTMGALALFAATLIWMPVVVPGGLACFIALYRRLSPWR